MRKKSLILFLIPFLFACKHTTKFSDFPEISYSKSIEPIIISNCTQSGCHGSNEKRRFELLSYDNVIKYCKVVAGSPEKSNLYSVINTYNSGNVMPPKPNNMLTDKQIELIYLWIGQGAKNN